MGNKFSIVIITLNEEKNIGNILQDLVHQSYTHFEVLIVDSNSSDNTEQEARKFENKFSEFRFIQMNDRGVSKGRNTGLQNAVYEDVIFFDADVRIQTDFLKQLNNYLEKNPKVDSGTFLISPKAKKTRYSIANILINIGNLLVNPFFPTCIGACIYTKKGPAMQVKGFDESMSLGEDTNFSMKLNQQGYNFSIIPVPFYFNPRRFEKEGTLKTLTSYLYSSYIFIVKRKKEHHINYDFGHYD